ncbi:response regulator [Opitutus sp. ER46]|uniref:response regulator n=1 Tax=Opitutus sp. ER46 TaxID=2161864 RepID=UPI000D317487|nr:response regulator [Opitutus sp. ER46]PTX91067.1 hybrid sensor histidine kinase/response regulator [Opitutus sp. ER46]
MSKEIIGRNHRILVVDDTRAIHEDFRKILAQPSAPGDPLAAAASSIFRTAKPTLARLPSFELESAFQGEEALAVVTRALAGGRPFAVAFVDVRMPPGWDGVETVNKLWSVQPDLQVVLCTAYSDYSWSELGDRLVHSDQLLLLKKPFDPIEVQQMAAALTEKWRLTQQSRLKIVDLEERVRERTAELERAQAELAQSRKMQAVGQLAGGIAHDYNNIVTATIIQLTMLRQHPDVTPAIKAIVADLESMEQRAASLTRQLLTFSRRQVMHVAVIDLNVVIEHLLKMLRRLLDECISVNFQPAPSPMWIEGDVGMIEQVITNLCVNARDAMKPRGGRLTIAVAPHQLEPGNLAARRNLPPGPYVKLTIEDTGCGMDAETLQRIYEPFFTTKDVGQGTGLGLATVYGIVQQHRGWSDVRSQVGQGTTFDVFFPAATAPATAPAAARPPAPAQPSSACILMVEDEEMVRQIVSRALKHKGYRVLQAVDGEAALEVWKQHGAEVDLLFSDMVMPNGVTGLDLAKRFRGERPDLKVLITSGYSVDLAISDPGQHGDFAYLGKPYDIADLLALLEKTIAPGP